MSETDETAVVTCFLRNGTDVLLCRRSESVGSYPGRWGGVAGHAEGDPDAAARREIREETGLGAAVALVRRGDPFPVDDPDHGRWVVHPYLFDCDSRAVEPNWETAEYEWADPTSILVRDAVPDLWKSYRAVAPTVAAVRDDREHGSASLSVRALEVVRDAAAEAVAGRTDRGWDALADLARSLLEARPAMAALRNRLDRVMHGARPGGTPVTVLEAAREGIREALAADEAAAGEAAAAVADAATVYTLSRSGTAVAALREADPALLVPESRPGGEGRGVAADLAAAGLDVTLTTDAAGPGLLERADAVLLGADAVLPDGTAVNKVGSYPAALAAARADVPTYVACASDKIAADVDAFDPEGDPDGLDAPDGVRAENPLFEAVPADLLGGIVTEDGVLDADDVSDVAARHGALAGWR